MRNIALALTTAMLVSACGNDDENYTYPPVVKEFATIGAGAGGNIETLITDDGATFAVNQDYTNTRVSQEGYYRVVTDYQPLTMPSHGTYGTVDIYTLASVYCARSVPASSVAGGYSTDPVEVRKAWRSGDFINIELGVMAQDKQHEFRFINEGIEAGTANAMVKLHHDDGGDYPAYTKTAYLSLQLAEFREEWIDSVAIYINTDEGWVRKAFATR